MESLRDGADGTSEGRMGFGPGAALIDPQAIERLRQLDPTGQQRVLERVLQAYQVSLGRHLADVEAALSQSNADQLARAAHTLKSSSAAVGALDFSQRCADIEQGIREHRTMPEAAPVEALIHEGRRVLLAVGAMLQSEPGSPR